MSEMRKCRIPHGRQIFLPLWLEQKERAAGKKTASNIDFETPVFKRKEVNHGIHP
jgi:hypothetical protein